jgi:hypothetical protein
MPAPRRADNGQRVYTVSVRFAVGSNMSMISLPRYRPTSRRWLVWVGLMSALVLAAYMVLAQFDASKECRGGAFSAAFSRGFDVRRCDLVLKRVGSEVVRIPLPQSLT